jgi:hypothetical protein
MSEFNKAKQMSCFSPSTVPLSGGLLAPRCFWIRNGPRKLVHRRPQLLGVRQENAFAAAAADPETAEIISASRKPCPPQHRNPTISAGADAVRWAQRRSRPSGAEGSSRRGERRQNSRVVVRVCVVSLSPELFISRPFDEAGEVSCGFRSGGFWRAHDSRRKAAKPSFALWVMR